MLWAPGRKPPPTGNANSPPSRRERQSPDWRSEFRNLAFQSQLTRCHVSSPVRTIQRSILDGLAEMSRLDGVLFWMSCSPKAIGRSKRIVARDLWTLGFLRSDSINRQYVLQSQYAFKLMHVGAAYHRQKVQLTRTHAVQGQVKRMVCMDMREFVFTKELA